MFDRVAIVVILLTGKMDRIAYLCNSMQQSHVEDIYRQISNISRTLVGSKIVDHSVVVETSPVGAAPTTSSFST